MKIKVSWGKTKVIENVLNTKYKDAMIHPTGHCEWDWIKSGTRHNPGIQIADIQFLVNNGSKIIILSSGMQDRLLLPENTKKWLEDQKNLGHIDEYHYLNTKPCVELLNNFIEFEKRHSVGCLIHSTC